MPSDIRCIKLEITSVQLELYIIDGNSFADSRDYCARYDSILTDHGAVIIGQWANDGIL